MINGNSSFLVRWITQGMSSKGLSSFAPSFFPVIKLDDNAVMMYLVPLTSFMQTCRFRMRMMTAPTLRRSQCSGIPLISMLFKTSIPT